MALQDKVILTCALSGVAANRDQCPGIPYTPEDYAEESRRAFDEGCTIVHIHARKPDGTPTQDIEHYEAIRDAIVEKVPEMVINFSTGAVMVTREERIHHIPALKPHIAALNMGTMNYAKYSRRRKDFVFNMMFLNPFEDIKYYLELMNENGVKPELECFDVGHVGNAYPFLDMGLLEPPLEFSFILGVTGGIPATTENIIAMRNNLPEGSNWQVIGISRDQWKLSAAALTLGGHVRVGFEDNFYLPTGEMAESNGNLVAAAAQMAREMGREPTSPAETREILHLA